MSVNSEKQKSEGSKKKSPAGQHSINIHRSRVSKEGLQRNSRGCPSESDPAGMNQHLGEVGQPESGLGCATAEGLAPRESNPTIKKETPDTTAQATSTRSRSGGAASSSRTGSNSPSEFRSGTVNSTAPPHEVEGDQAAL